MASNKRMSMNTSLKNARIFDDDSWDEETAFLARREAAANNETAIKIKQEPEERRENGFQNVKLEYKPKIKEEPLVINVKIKTENVENVDEAARHSFNIGTEVKPKIEVPSEESSTDSEESSTDSDINTKMKRELGESDDSSREESDIDIEKELEENETDSSTEARAAVGYCNVTMETPVKNEIRAQTFIIDTTPSPFNKELFKNFSLGQDSPQIKEEPATVESRKSVKRTVFKRESPYKRYSDDSPQPSTRLSVKERLGPKLNDECNQSKNYSQNEATHRYSVRERLGQHIESDEHIPCKRQKMQLLESDPTILARRQKQIDFGRNTLGYDNYIKKVPKSERSRDDPQTPNKFMQYSRRAWDGLIKQWRLKLHKYDLTET